MALNLLAIVQEFCRGRALPVPNGVQGSADAQITQIQAMLNELCFDLITRRGFQQNTREATFTSIAAEDQGDINTLAPYGFEGIMLESLFDRTQRLPLYGGLGSSEWQARKAFQITGPEYQFRLRNDKFLFNPALPADHEIAFEYFSSYFIVNNSGSGDPYKPYWTLDTDTFVWGDAIPLAWLKWKWPSAKGFDYAEEFNAYERLIAAKLSRTNAPPRIHMDDGQRDFTPGIWVPAGNWPV